VSSASPLSPQFQPPEHSSDSLGITIRVAQPKDIGDLVDVLSSSFHDRLGMMSWFSPILRLGMYEDLRQRLRSPRTSDYVCLVAVASRLSQPQPEIVGTVEVTLRSTSLWQLFHSPYPYLSNLAVRSDSRRQGVAFHLLHACEKAVSDWGCCDLYLHVLEDNHQAKRLYFRAGYQLQQADPWWHCRLLNRPRRLLLHKALKP